MKLEGKAGGILVDTSAAPIVLIPLSTSGRKGDGSMRYTIIDLADYQLVRDTKWQACWNWSARAFYAKASIGPISKKRKTVAMHRILMGDPKGLQVDHRNLISLDNRRVNLRVCTVSQNCCNRRVRRDNQAGLRGVGFDRYRWRARIRHKGELISLGHFPTAQEAAAAYDVAARRLFGEFAWTNS